MTWSRAKGAAGATIGGWLRGDALSDGAMGRGDRDRDVCRLWLDWD